MQWVDTIIQGILLGGLYALYATGLSLMFGIMKLVNLAHGDLIVLAAFVIVVLASLLPPGSGVVLALLLSLPIMFGVGYGLQVGFLNRTLDRDILPPLIVTFGFSIIIQNGLLEVFSADSRRLPLTGWESASLSVASGISIGTVPLVCFASAVVVIAGLNFLIYRTAIGRAFRATSDDPETAQLMGIDHRRLFAIAAGIAMMVCAVAALYLGLRANFDPTIGPARLLYAFEAVIVGGLGSLWGTLIGGMIIGVAQTVGAQINPEWQILTGHLAFLVILVVRPRGLFPKSEG
ncbi:MAG: branched-chain amino acid ABC transporter permease [Alphaproteobacteria bacterium]|nr:branched-chain amino acid ABC transporter permease [Alphaproteobacteria bacterium]